MSISTSYLSSQSSLQRQYPPRNGPVPQNARKPGGGGRDSILFGQKRTNGVFVTTERLPAQAGGLGMVSKTIPDAISKYTDKDLRIIVPYEKANLDYDTQHPEHAFKPTNHTIQVKTNKGKDTPAKTYNFKVLQKFEPATNAQNERQGNWVYALQSDLFLEQGKKPGESPKDTGISQYTYDGEDDVAAKKRMIFNQAAAELISRLKKNAPDSAAPLQSGEEQLHRFEEGDGNVDFVIGNDHLSGPVLYQPQIQQDPNIRKIFMLHNTYDTNRGAGFLDHVGVRIPKYLKTEKDSCSALHLSLKAADAVIANKNYVKTITNTDFAKGDQFRDILTEHSEKGRIQDMHHGLAENYTPSNNPVLRENFEAGMKDYEAKVKKAQQDKKPQVELNRIIADKPQRDYQFEELQEDTPEGWQQFKQANKLALQNKLGLDPNPHATVIGWAARFDPSQKGFYTVQNAMEDLLSKNKNLQVVIAGNSGSEKDPSLERWSDYMRAKYPGQIYIPYLFKSTPEVTQINAGSDFIMLPSLYEPYGLTQLEAMKMGAIPIVHGVDGIRSTVSDPEVNGRDFIGRSQSGKEFDKTDEHAWFNPETGEEWQTGILMKPQSGHDRPIDVPRYRRELDYERAMRNLEIHVSEHQKNYSGGSTKEEKKEFNAQAAKMAKLITNLEKEQKRRAEDHESLVFSEAELQKLSALREKLEGLAPSISFKDKTEVFDKIIRPKIVDPALKPAENSFIEAVGRALGMDDETRAKVRRNALQFVNTSHTWDKIVDPYKAPKIEFYSESPFLAKDKPSVPKNGNKPSNKKPATPNKTFFQQAWDWIIYIISFGWLRSLFGGNK
jgi:glycogen synthase